MNRILLIALLALSCASTANANQRAFGRLASCFNSTTYPETGDTLGCLGNVSTCFDSSTVSTIQTCIQDGIAAAQDDSGTRYLAGHTGASAEGLGAFRNKPGFGSGGFRPQKAENLGKLAGIVQGCLEEYKDCIKEEVQTFVKKLPTCVNTTAVALGQCYKTNAATCSSTCSEADIPDSNPFAGVVSSGIKSCQGFQNRIMDPSCDIVDCCEPCKDSFDELMDCIGQDILKLKPEPCDLTCPAARRKLGGERKQYVERKLAGHLAVEPDAATVVDECAIYLDTEEDTLTADAVTEKILDGEFIGCVADVALLVAEEQKEFAADHNTGGSGTDGSSSSHVMVVTRLAAVLLGLVGFM
ncbi:MAG: hypothetical protein SGBAC_013450 [Bacillariaceae sp.]